MVPHQLNRLKCEISIKDILQNQTIIDLYGEENAFYQIDTYVNLFLRFTLYFAGLTSTSYIERFHMDKIISESGTSLQPQKSQQIYPKTLVRDTYKLVNYVDDDTIWSIFNSPPPPQLFFQTTQAYGTFLHNFKSDQITFYFEFLQTATTYRRYPDSLLMGFAKLGGLIALLKVSLLLRFIHQKLFEREIMKQEGNFIIK